MIGISYAGIQYKGSEESLHKVLTLYRVDKDHPMGKKSTEITFEISKDNSFLGWVVFQMDMELLEREYSINEEDLEKLQFNKP